MTNVYIAMALLYVMGILSGIMFCIIHENRKQRKIDRIYLPEYDPNNPLNGGPRPEDVIHTEYGDLYRIHPGV